MPFVNTLRSSTTVSFGKKRRGIAGSPYASVTEGELFAWGQNDSGQIGLNFRGSTYTIVSPVQITSSTNWKTLGQNGNALAIKSDNTMWSWGLNQYGQTGLNNNATFSYSPKQVPGTDWSIPSTGSGATARLNAVIKTNGSLWVFGRNYGGALGLGDTVNRSSPVQLGALTNWANVTVQNAGYIPPGYTNPTGCSLAVKTDGTLWAWGGNRFGTLGLGDTVNRSSPTQVTGSSDWSKVYAGTNFCMALKTSGTLWAWGKNYNGTLGLGDSNPNSRSSPTQIGGTWKQVNPGYNFCVGIKSDDTVWNWGNGSSGQLGRNNTTLYSSPVQMGVLNDWSKVVSMQQSCGAIKKDFTAWAWGRNQHGQLSQEDLIDRSSPTQIGTDKNWIGITSFDIGTFKAIKAVPLVAPTFAGTPTVTGTAQAQSPVIVSVNYIGNGVNLTFQWQANSVDIPGARSKYYTISPKYVGQTLRCVVTATNAAGSVSVTSSSTSSVTELKGYLWAWGKQNGFGLLGLGDTANKSSPIQVGSSANWTVVSVGYQASAAIADGKLYVTGRNDYGKLGSGDTNNRTTFGQVGGNTNWYSVSMTRTFCAALKTDGTLWAWGNAGTGQLGQNTSYPNRSSPVQIGTDTNWMQVSAAYRNCLAVKTDGTIWSWGQNNGGQLGLGDTVYRSSPTQIGALTNWQKVNGVTGFAVASKTDGTLWAWGSNGAGQFGNNNTVSKSSPVQVDSFKFNGWTNVIATSNLMCLAGKQDGTLWAWGSNGNGGLGLDTSSSGYSVPKKIGTLTDWNYGAKMSGGNGANCQIIKSNGTWWNWGYNGTGQLGRNDTTNRSSPVQLGALTNWLATVRNGTGGGEGVFGIKS